MLISSQLLLWKIDLKFAIFILRANSFMSPRKIGGKGRKYPEIFFLGQGLPQQDCPQPCERRALRLTVNGRICRYSAPSAFRMSRGRVATMLTNEGRQADCRLRSGCRFCLAFRCCAGSYSPTLLPLLSRATRMPFDCVTMLPILLPLLSVRISSAVAS